MAKTKVIGHQWQFCTLWNQAINSIPGRPLVKRDYCYASELGGAFVDRYLRMHAVPYSNPPNERSRRKFFVGEIFEWTVKMMLRSIGILKDSQVRAMVELPNGLLKVSGKLDFIA